VPPGSKKFSADFLQPDESPRVKSSVNDDFNSKDPLWDLLGQARPTEVRQGFACDVIRNIRHSSPAEDPEATWQVVLRWLLPPVATATLAVCLALAFDSSAQTNLVTFEDLADFESIVASSAGWTWEEVAP